MKDFEDYFKGILEKEGKIRLPRTRAFSSQLNQSRRWIFTLKVHL
jgi:hypothetical protein